MHAAPRRTLRTLFRTAVALVFGALLLTALPGKQASAASTLMNTGFESGTSSWSTYSATGQHSASYAEWGGHDSDHRLTHWSSSAYEVETYQYLTGLAEGDYTLSAWVRSSGGQNSAYIALRNCGSAEQRTALPPTPNGEWIRIVTSVWVTGGQCTISINSDANAGNWINVDDLSLTRGWAGLPVKGVDLSLLQESEDRGGSYRFADGTTGDAIEILQSAGANYVRLKVWVDPADGYNNKARVLETAQRVKARGMKLLIDFHYSDTWADPGAQTKPSAWSSHSYDQLTTDVYDYTYDVLGALEAQGTSPDMVQVGNEINWGMLWPDGSTDDFSKLAGLLKSGIAAVRDASPSVQVALHLAHGGDNGHYRWWFDNVTAQGVDFDVIALSFYGYWHGDLSDLQANLDDISARYDKPVLVVETAYPFRLDSEDDHENIIDTTEELVPGYPATPAGQADWFRDVMNVVEAVPNGRGLGVVYWGPAWTAVPGNGWDPADPSSGNGWENQALFDYQDRLLPAAEQLDHR